MKSQKKNSSDFELYDIFASAIFRGLKNKKSIRKGIL